MEQWIQICVSLLICVSYVNPGEVAEFMFVLRPDHKECYYDYMEKNETVVLNYGVIGENMEIDVAIMNPHKLIIYQKHKISKDTYTFACEETGIYEMCFQADSESASPRKIYIYFYPGIEKAVRGAQLQETALTLVETYANNIHKHLNNVSDMQVQHRLKGRSGFDFARQLNRKVMTWSVFELFAIIVVAISQVYILRRFFNGKSVINSKNGISI